MISATDIGRELINQAIDLKIISSNDKISFKATICGNDYFVDLDDSILANKSGVESAWISIFKEFEKDLDHGISTRSPEERRVIL